MNAVCNRNDFLEMIWLRGVGTKRPLFRSADKSADISHPLSQSTKDSYKEIMQIEGRNAFWRKFYLF